MTQQVPCNSFDGNGVLQVYAPLGTSMWSLCGVSGTGRCEKIDLAEVSRFQV
jgi:hypothetical protein